MTEQSPGTLASGWSQNLRPAPTAAWGAGRGRAPPSSGSGGRDPLPADHLPVPVHRDVGPGPVVIRSKVTVGGSKPFVESVLQGVELRPVAQMPRNRNPGRFRDPCAAVPQSSDHRRQLLAFTERFGKQVRLPCPLGGHGGSALSPRHTRTSSSRRAPGPPPTTGNGRRRWPQTVPGTAACPRMAPGCQEGLWEDAGWDTSRPPGTTQNSNRSPASTLQLLPAFSYLSGQVCRFSLPERVRKAVSQ